MLDIGNISDKYTKVLKEKEKKSNKEETEDEGL